MTLEQIESQIKEKTQIIRSASKELEQLFILKEIELEKMNGQISMDEL